MKPELGFILFYKNFIHRYLLKILADLTTFGLYTTYMSTRLKPVNIILLFSLSFLFGRLPQQTFSIPTHEQLYWSFP